MRYAVQIAQTIFCETEVTASSREEAEEMALSALERGMDSIGGPEMPASRFPGFDFRWGEGEPIETVEIDEIGD